MKGEGEEREGRGRERGEDERLEENGVELQPFVRWFGRSKVQYKNVRIADMKERANRRKETKENYSHADL